MPPLLADLGIFVLGVALLLAGGEALVRGAVTMAVRLRVSPLIIGLTVVAFGTSAPELAFNVIAAAKNNDELSFGNIVGSNIANVGLVLAIAALIRPMQVHVSIIRRELPQMLALSALTVALALIPWPVGSWRAPGDGLARLDGAALLACFGAFMWLTLRTAKSQRASASEAERSILAEEFEQIDPADRARPLWRATLFFVAGLAGLIAGGQLAEIGAAGVARELGVSDQLIGLTVVAIATSLPELVVSALAALRGRTDIAVGNVVGSNIFNLSLVLGATAMVNPVALPPGGIVSLGVMALLSGLLIPMSRTHNRHVSRLEGTVLLATYVAYVAYEIWDALGRNAGPIGATP